MSGLHEQLSLFLTQFHWLRPWWLLAFIPLLLLTVLLWKQKRHAHQWQHIIAPELLPFLIDGKTTAPKKSLLWGLIFAWIISTLALAGPSWIKRPTPVEKNQNALIILLDLSISMYSEDVKPSRLVRARLKIADILRERKDGQTALVVYAGEAHTVTPLSDDSGTILSLLPSLQPAIMPLGGSNTEDAIARGIQLLHDAGAHQGNLLLITDGVVPEAFPKVHELLSHNDIHLNILGVGTNQPAPVPSGNGGGFLHDKQGAIITTQLNSSELNSLAQQVHGRYSDIANNDSDIDYLLPKEDINDKSKPTLERDFDQWFDQGHWLVFLLLPIVLFCFKRGIILVLICAPLLGLTPSPVYAFGWDDLWLTKDQQASRQLNNGDAKAAATEFESPEWKASAQYRAGDYAAAAESFSKIDTASAHYNRGNALAKSNKLEDAIKAYDEALKRDPQLEDATKNRALVEKLLKQQKEQNQKNSDKNQDKKDQNKDDQNKDDQNKDDKKDSDKQDSDKKDSDKKDSENRDKSQQDQNQQNKQDKSGQNNNEQNKDQQSSQGQNDQSKQGQEGSSAGQPQNGAQSSAGSDAQSNPAQAENSSAAGSQAQQQMAQASSHATDDKNSDQKQPADINESNLTPEQKQALEQWLRRVPDDPGGLLRNKFKWQSLQNRQKKADGEFESPENHADQRW